MKLIAKPGPPKTSLIAVFYKEIDQVLNIKPLKPYAYLHLSPLGGYILNINQKQKQYKLKGESEDAIIKNAEKLLTQELRR